ncbi:hypothetical protein NiCM35_19800 [Niallia circulans]|uniref:hypothetical protein n=1 Tax=Niallia circulans TaxID=1397 RepID=UPI003D99468A
MKKILIFISALTLSLIVGCGNQEEATKNTNQAVNQEDTEQKKEEVKTEVTNKVFYKWNNESVGNVPQIVTYATIENTGNVPVNVADTQLTYIDKDGGVIGTTKANGFYANIAPSSIGPGETAYLAINEDIDEQFDNLKDVEINVAPMKMEIGVNSLKSDKLNVIKKDEWGGMLSVTGFILNDTEINNPVVEAGAGLFDKDNKFVGAVLLGSDNEIKVSANNKTGVEFSVPSFPSSEIDKVDHAKVSAIYYDEN